MNLLAAILIGAAIGAAVAVLLAARAHEPAVTVVSTMQPERT
ncbi:MAG: hypothetical protein WD058_06260 [Dehalococcoidia bacterium]